MNKFFALFAVLVVLQCGQPEAFAIEEEINAPVEEPVQEAVLPYDYTDTTAVPVRLAVTKEISSEKGLLEGQSLEFRIVRDVYYNDKLLLAKGTIVSGKVETIVTSGMNGFPAEVLIDGFELPGIRQSQLLGGYIKKGQNRCFWVYPLKWALTLIPVAGSLTNFIKGGHVKIHSDDIITIYYYPNWL